MIRPAPEFYYLAEAYFHQDFAELYENLDELIKDIAGGFEEYGSKSALKDTLLDLASRLSDQELVTLWRNTNAQVHFLRGDELRELLKMIAAAL